jgi:signal transduction histidine kinase/DNA-binding response OmpR family regulator
MKLQAKVLAVFLPLAAISALVVSYAGSRATEKMMVRELGGRLRPQVEDFAAVMAKDMESGRESGLLARLQAAQAFSGAVFAEALSPDGVVVAHTNVLETGKRRDDAAAREALESAKTVFARAESPRGSLMVLSTPVWRADDEFLLSGGPRKRLGTLRLGLPLAATLESARRVGAFVAGLIVGISLLALGLSLSVLRYVLRPLRAMAAATARVASGDYGAVVPAESADELGDLAAAFNRMGAALSRTVVSRDRLEEALAIARATLDASADGILVVDRDAKVVTCNRRFLDMWGIPDELARATTNDKLVEYVAPQIADQETFQRGVVRSGSNFEERERRDLLTLKDGRVFERISQPYLLGGRAVGRTLTFRDLTLHLEGVKALALARDEAVETARVKSQFLANVSHELRTPLNAVVGGAELLGELKLPLEAREHVSTVASASRALLDLVDGVLDFSKIEAGRMTVERAPLRLERLLADSLALVAARASEKGLVLSGEAGEAASWELLGDRTRLRQVLLNLLANAVKFTERGVVSTTVIVTARGEASVELEFSVQDTGIGIPRDQAERLFSPFTQGDGSTTRRYGGTGLGLAISKSLVELMGGTIGFESEAGRGARFWFRVKLERASAPPSPPPPKFPVPTGRRDRLRVLVVEDNRLNRRLLERQLERLGCPCVAVGEGHAALDRLRAEDFGLILLDCQMPGLDGYATAREIRLQETGKRRTPIVAITANATEEDRRRCLDSGMDDFVPKPVTLEPLYGAVERWDRPFDEVALAAFAFTAADTPAALDRMLEEFLADSEARLTAARAAQERGDAEARGHEAHSVRGAAAAVGAGGLRELCRRIEAAAPDEDFPGLLHQAETELVRLRVAAARRAAA